MFSGVSLNVTFLFFKPCSSPCYLLMPLGTFLLFLHGLSLLLLIRVNTWAMANLLISLQCPAVATEPLNLPPSLCSSFSLSLSFSFCPSSSLFVFLSLSQCEGQCVCLVVLSFKCTVNMRIEEGKQWTGSSSSNTPFACQRWILKGPLWKSIGAPLDLLYAVLPLCWAMAAALGYTTRN